MIILVQFLRYGPREWSLPKQVFYVGFGLALITSFFAVLLLTLELNDSGVYAAFGQNLMMSVLFIVMLYHRRSLRGQSVSIAICKCLGTALASLAFVLYYPYPSVILTFLYIAILVYDVVYIALVLYVRQRVETKAIHVATTGSYEMESSVSSN